MELGAKLRQARLELGLSQRQLCGDVITRNMLSQIENGSARPSMDTLTYLAGRLNRPVSYFLEETAFVSSNTSCIANARQAYIEGCFADALQILQEYQSPDALLDAEFGLLKYLALLYNYVVINDEIEKATDKVSAILISEKCRVDRIEEVFLNNKEELIHEGLLDDKEFDKIEAIISSMSAGERANPKILNASRRRRIAAGSGTQVHDINKFMESFEMTQKMMKQMKNNKFFRF